MLLMVYWTLSSKSWISSILPQLWTLEATNIYRHKPYLQHLLFVRVRKKRTCASCRKATLFAERWSDVHCAYVSLSRNRYSHGSLFYDHSFSPKLYLWQPKSTFVVTTLLRNALTRKSPFPDHLVLKQGPPVTISLHPRSFKTISFRETSHVITFVSWLTSCTQDLLDNLDMWALVATVCSRSWTLTLT